jgi:hypothetical protein
VQTIVMVRHGEKPEAGLGQLDCQGLNRSLALPPVLAKFGRPDAIFAPDPGQAKKDGGVVYSYVRPLATIEPTAIALGMPVDASLGFADIAGLQHRLEAAPLRGALVLVAWEHWEIVQLSRKLLAAHGGNPASVPDWDGGDFDAIYIVRITHTAARDTATFERGTEGLDGQKTTCPGAPN